MWIEQSDVPLTKDWHTDEKPAVHSLADGRKPDRGRSSGDLLDVAGTTPRMRLRALAGPTQMVVGRRMSTFEN